MNAAIATPINPATANWIVSRRTSRARKSSAPTPTADQTAVAKVLPARRVRDHERQAGQRRVRDAVAAAHRLQQVERLLPAAPLLCLVLAHDDEG